MATTPRPGRNESPVLHGSNSALKFDDSKRAGGAASMAAARSSRCMMANAISDWLRKGDLGEMQEGRLLAFFTRPPH
jgi:hypothetical protein